VFSRTYVVVLIVFPGVSGVRRLSVKCPNVWGSRCIIWCYCSSLDSGSLDSLILALLWNYKVRWAVGLLFVFVTGSDSDMRYIFRDLVLLQERGCVSRVLIPPPDSLCLRCRTA